MDEEDWKRKLDKHNTYSLNFILNSGLRALIDYPNPTGSTSATHDSCSTVHSAR